MKMSESGLSLVCRVQNRRCAFPIHYVIETMRPLPSEPVPGAPGFVDGLSIIRGGPVPVVDMARLLGSDAGQPSRFVCIRTDHGTVALAVDEVLGVRILSEASLG